MLKLDIIRKKKKKKKREEEEDAYALSAVNLYFCIKKLVAYT